MSQLKDRKQLYVNGEWLPAGAVEAVLNPATEQVIGEAPVGDFLGVRARR